jgi:hypothetical protein
MVLCKVAHSDEARHAARLQRLERPPRLPPQPCACAGPRARALARGARPVHEQEVDVACASARFSRTVG